MHVHVYSFICRNYEDFWYFQEDTYEEPDAGSQTAPPPPVPSSTHRRKAPSPVSIEVGPQTASPSSILLNTQEKS